MGVVTALAGNKSDMSSLRKVPQKEAQQYAQENGLIFFETSAKQSTNVNEVFLAIGKNRLAVTSFSIFFFDFFFF